MSDVPVYMVVNLHVTNAEEYRVYEKGFFPLLKKYGGTFVTYDDQTYTFEGTPREGRMIIFSFPSEEQARDWFADPDYPAPVDVTLHVGLSTTDPDLERAWRCHPRPTPSSRQS